MFWSDVLYGSMLVGISHQYLFTSYCGLSVKAWAVGDRIKVKLVKRIKTLRDLKMGLADIGSPFMYY